MQVQKAFKFALLPSVTQAAFFRRTVGACRFLWNRALAEQHRRRGAKEERLTYAGLGRELTAWRAAPDTAWLSEHPAQVQQQKLKDLERAFTNLFQGRAAPPRYRRRGDSDSFRVPQYFAVDMVNGRVKIPKLGWVRYCNHRRIEGNPKNVTISQRAGRWYVSIQVELEVPEPQHPSPALAVGLDAGVVSFATLSTGEQFAPLASFKKHEERLAWAQRKLARKKKGSNNWKTQKHQVQRIHATMADVRSDFLHKASDQLTQRFGVIAIEDLDLSSMTKSAKGTVAQPGRNVRPKSGLNKALLNHGFGEFRRQLEYKAKWRGGSVIAVDPQHTSQTCPRCSLVSAANRRSQAAFACVQCGFSGQADVVAAENILNRARSARSACSPEAASPVSAEAPASKSRSKGSRGRNHCGTRDAAKSTDGDRGATLRRIGVVPDILPASLVARKTAITTSTDAEAVPPDSAPGGPNDRQSRESNAGQSALHIRGRSRDRGGL